MNVLAELEDYVRSHAALVAGRGRVDDIIGFIDWVKANERLETEMPYKQTYTFLDDKWHAIGWGEHTQCNLAIPLGSGYVTELPAGKKAHCGPDTKITEAEPDNADPVASKAKADEQAAKVAGTPLETVTGEAAEEAAPAGEVAKSAKGAKKA